MASLLDNAGDQIMEMAWNSQSELFEQSYQGLMFGLEEAAAHGITTIGDGRMYWKRGWYDVWLEAEQTKIWRLVCRCALGFTHQWRYLAIRSLREDVFRW